MLSEAGEAPLPRRLSFMHPVFPARRKEGNIRIGEAAWRKRSGNCPGRTLGWLSIRREHMGEIYGAGPRQGKSGKIEGSERLLLSPSSYLHYKGRREGEPQSRDRPDARRILANSPPASLQPRRCWLSFRKTKTKGAAPKAAGVWP